MLPPGAFDYTVSYSKLYVVSMSSRTMYCSRRLFFIKSHRLTHAVATNFLRAHILMDLNGLLLHIIGLSRLYQLHLPILESSCIWLNLGHTCNQAATLFCFYKFYNVAGRAHQHRQKALEKSKAFRLNNMLLFLCCNALHL